MIQRVELPRACNHRNSCGSELARDGGNSVNIFVEFDGLIASKLAPTGTLGVRMISSDPAHPGTAIRPRPHPIHLLELPTQMTLVGKPQQHRDFHR
jgi:hypothetical protein